MVFGGRGLAELGEDGEPGHGADAVDLVDPRSTAWLLCAPSCAALNRTGRARCRAARGRRAGVSGGRSIRGSRARAGCGVAGTRGGRALSASAAGTRCAGESAGGGSGPGRGDQGGAPAGSTTPAAGRSTAAPRRCRASAQSLFARFFLPFSAAASAGSARWTSAPTRSSSSTRTASQSSPPTRPPGPLG
jgi:hypothetical protein